MIESALDGIRVIDLSFWLPGPYCSRILADLGAEVIKVERQLMGDPMRLAPPMLDGESCYFLAVNRNKKSLAVNLKRPQGREIYFRLVRTADVVLEGFRPGKMDGLGIGYDAVSAVNPQIVYCSLSGYGQQGPYADRAGHDINYAALAGLLDLLPPGGTPILPAVQFADLAGALYATIAILTALIRRGRQGKGGYLDVSMLDATVGLLSPSAAALMRGLAAGESYEILAGALPGYNLYRTKDGRWMALGALEPIFWSQFCQAIGRPDLVGRQFPDKSEQKAVIAELQQVFAGRTQGEWIRLLGDKEVCCEPVLSLEEALARPELEQRGMVFYLQHPSAGRVGQIGLPVRFSREEGERREATSPPLLGEHTAEILQELAYSEAEIEGLIHRRIVATPEEQVASTGRHGRFG